ncbi:MAG: ABC transporter permease [Clostridiaceae bacterium]|nr:ABC transporter permease [Clostridiaceae bacterium]
MNDNPIKSVDHTANAGNEHISTSTSLDDEQRIKVLSPGMLVFKRFIRNRLAIVGFFIILFMFLFSFVGGLISPYGETQVFTYVGTMAKEYASVTHNNQFRYTVVEGKEYGDAAHAKFILAKNQGASVFNHNDTDYGIVQEAEDFYRITQITPIANITYFRGIFAVNPIEGNEISGTLEEAVKAAIDSGAEQFELEGDIYTIKRQNRDYVLGKSETIALESMYIIDPADKDLKIDFDFKYAAEKAIRTTDSGSFSVHGDNFAIDEYNEISVIYKVNSGERIPYAIVSEFAIQPSSPEIFLSLDFKATIQRAITNNQASFVFEDEKGSTEYTITKLNNVYTIKTETPTHLINMYESPSKRHWLGTDAHGMDVLTRLMYGGRVSLLIGFIVVFLETLIGVILGGIAGYFGKWVDMLIMRIVDVFNCIPFLPLVMIVGSVMDSMDIEPQMRIYYLMLVLGVMSWTGIARMVRGQILSLREQEFMIAAEATGLRTSKRIFKHLVPNVVPQLIVLATLGLGNIILYESTLSYFGLGVKFPLASWGNIISDVSTAYEMTNYWFLWIPAGLLILLTVLGFNFVGDGLRDAFDPKMKR